MRLLSRQPPQTFFLSIQSCFQVICCRGCAWTLLTKEAILKLSHMWRNCMCRQRRKKGPADIRPFCIAAQTYSCLVLQARVFTGRTLVSWVPPACSCPSISSFSVSSSWLLWPPQSPRVTMTLQCGICTSNTSHTPTWHSQRICQNFQNAFSEFYWVKKDIYCVSDKKIEIEIMRIQE